MTLFCRSSDLLPFVLPSHLHLKDTMAIAEVDKRKCLELTAAGLSGTFTRFPFIRDFAKPEINTEQTLQIYIFLETK